MMSRIHPSCPDLQQTRNVPWIGFFLLLLSIWAANPVRAAVVLWEFNGEDGITVRDAGNERDIAIDMYAQTYTLASAWNPTLLAYSAIMAVNNYSGGDSFYLFSPGGSTATAWSWAAKTDGSSHVLQLSQGDAIGADGFTQGGDLQQNWDIGDRGYMGIRWQTGSGNPIYWGWMDIERVGAREWKLYATAYNDVGSEGILAGEGYGPSEAVPEPAAAASLLLGIGLLFVLRRKRLLTAY